MNDQTKNRPHNKIKYWLLNVTFLLTCVAIIAFLASAPEETTSPLPHDEIHETFHSIESKKEAEKYCLKCHDEGMESQLPIDHPPKYRCLFCHKRN